MTRISLLALLLPLAACGSAAAPQLDATPTVDGGGLDLTADSKSAGPLANVYKVDPTQDQRQTSQVLLKEITNAQGALIGKYVNVWQCTRDPNGPQISIDLNGTKLSGRLCTVTQKAAPGPDGTYLHILPPSTDTDGTDPFSEVMMYHHVTTIADYFLNHFGLTRTQKSLRAMVNIQGYVDSFGLWVGIPNAAYFPQSSASWVKKLLNGNDLMNGEEAILFSYNNLVPTNPLANYAYDASVIYHEYTHFMNGDRLMGLYPDQYGIDATPLALAEALADYMSASYLNRSTVGSYSMGSPRDLTRDFKCPGHMVGEAHHDGEIAGGALWAARTELGAEVLDAAIWRVTLGFGSNTTFEQAATALLAEVKEVAAAKEPTVKQIFTDHGLLGCVRLVDHQDFPIDSSNSGTKPEVPGVGEVAVKYPDGMPGAVQYRLAITEGTKELTFEYAAEEESFWGLGADPAELWVALRKSSSPIIYEYTNGVATSNAQQVLKGVSASNVQKLVLTGSCVSKGDLVFQFLNRGPRADITKVKITQSPTVTQQTPNFDGC